MKWFLFIILVGSAINCCTRAIEPIYFKEDPVVPKEPSRDVSVEGMNKHDSVITRARLLIAKGIIPEANSLQIVSFTYVFGSCQLSEFIITGSEFREFDKKHFLTVRPGPMLYFYEIKARDSKGNIISLKPFDYRFIE